MTEALRFRPHHFLCALGYVGKGYSEAFTANMTALVDGRLRGPGGDHVLLEVTETADAICAPCPSRRGEGCEKSARIAALDRAHGRALGLNAGDRLTWGEAKARIRANVAPGGLAAICAGCQWLALGVCEAALSRLHDEEKA